MTQSVVLVSTNEYAPHIASACNRSKRASAFEPPQTLFLVP